MDFKQVQKIAKEQNMTKHTSSSSQLQTADQNVTTQKCLNITIYSRDKLLSWQNTITRCLYPPV